MGLNGIYQKPYLAGGSPNFVKRKQDQESSAAQNSKEDNTPKKGLDYRENYRETPKNLSPDYPGNNRPSWEETRALIQNQAFARNTHNQPEQIVESADNFTLKNSRINIAQILRDFKNTQAAIGTPDNIKEEVNQYIELIEKQVLKDNPNIKLIKSNLKNASSLLDEYISNTLNKDSKVVENWVDALFLQQIDFKYNEDDVNPQFLVKFPEGTKRAENDGKLNPAKEEPVETDIQNQNSLETREKPNGIPEDKELKSMFLKAKKLAYADKPDKAIINFEKALNRAKELGDNETVSKVYYEVGRIYDDHDYYAQALKSYNLVLEGTQDTILKTKAHYSMAQIYDDINEITPALDHYYVSAAYAGEDNNAVAQSTSLTRMGNIYKDMYDTNSLNYYDAAYDIAKSTDNSKVKGFVSSNMASAYAKFGEPKEALKSFGDAVKYYDEAESPTKVVQNYIAASEIMLNYGNTLKSINLLKKAQKAAIQASNIDLINSVNLKIKSLNIS